jgi:ferrous iron transport protein B
MKKIALLGNPNTGKSSVFNLLTGLNQKVGNFAGVTVSLKTGLFRLGEEEIQLIDFPGTYSVFARNNEEKIVGEVMSNDGHKFFPDALIVVVDASNLERNLLLVDQLSELNLPTTVVLNMSDVVARRGLKTDIEGLKKAYPLAHFVEINARVKMGRSRLLDGIKEALKDQPSSKYTFPFVLDSEGQKNDVEKRRNKIESLMSSLQSIEENGQNKSKYFDRILLHPIFGYVIFLGVLLVVFQSIFSLAVYPMDWIDSGFTEMSNALLNVLPEGQVADLLCNGVIAGIGGVVVFIPQIAFLFFFLGVLEETGYLSRVIFLMDRIMRPLGLNGRSVVPLMSSLACAIPGVMSARMISNWKERMITIFVAPLMSCSARIPVYTILIALVIPNTEVLGFINVQGLVLLGLYLLGLFSALLIAYLMKWMIKDRDRSFLLLELPAYKMPRWKNVTLMMYDKTKGFVVDAGKIILAISIVLWFTASYGPSGEVKHLTEVDFPGETIESSQQLASVQLENSFIGIFGLAIEPVIKPLGYDWKIGIALITSFAAREVFVGTLATIYAVEEDEDENQPLLQQMKSQTFSNGQPVFTIASGISLMVFYVYALQCMATVAVVKKETQSWKWPVIQLVFMGVLAYLASYITFVILK